MEGVNVNSVRLTCISQFTDSPTAKLEIQTQHKSAIPHRWSGVIIIIVYIAVEFITMNIIITCS